MDVRDDSPVSKKLLPDEIARNLRQMRQRKRISVTALATESGLPHELIEALEKGQIGMHSQSAVEDLSRVARALGVEFADLVERSGQG